MVTLDDFRSSPLPARRKKCLNSARRSSPRGDTPQSVWCPSVPPAYYTLLNASTKWNNVLPLPHPKTHGLLLVAFDSNDFFSLSLHSTQLNSSSSSLAAPYLPRFWREKKKRIPTLAVCPSGDFSFFRPRATWCDNSGTSAALPDLALRMFQTHEYSGGIRAFCVPPLLHQTTSPCERFKTIKTRN